MARLSSAARRQINHLNDFYLLHDRVEAVWRLTSAVEDAVRRVDEDRAMFRSYPVNYRELERLNMRWTKVHAYWFGCVTAPDGEIVFANVLHEGADMPLRAEPFDEDQ